MQKGLPHPVSVPFLQKMKELFTGAADVAAGRELCTLRLCQMHYTLKIQF